MPYKNQFDKHACNREKQLCDPWHRHLAAERQRRYRARQKKKAAKS